MKNTLLFYKFSFLFLTLFFINTNFCRNTSNDHKIMIGNFFNILIKSMQAITSTDKQDQIASTAEAFESIANIALLVCDNKNTRSYTTLDLETLTARLYKTTVLNKEFMEEFSQYGEQLITEIISFLPHDVHVQTD